MATKERIKTRCPICRSKYMVPTTLVGHRARCAKCKATFRVAEHNHHPTEDAIVRLYVRTGYGIYGTAYGGLETE